MMALYVHGAVADDATAASIQAAADDGAVELHLDHRPEMTDVPGALKILRDQLEVLSLHNNYSLKALPQLLGDLRQLRSLDASYCGLTTVSPAICRLRRLTRLQLSNNKIHFLPTEFGQLKALEGLHIDSNKMCVLPGGLVFLPRLTELTVENNPLYTPEQIEGAAQVTLVPPQPSVDCANCCVLARNYCVSISFHRLPCLPRMELPFAFFLCSEECRAHMADRLAKHDATMKALE